MPEFKIVVDGWFPHESETDRVFEIDLRAFWRLSQDRIADFVKELLLRLGFDERFEVILVKTIESRHRLVYRQRTRPPVVDSCLPQNPVFERIPIEDDRPSFAEGLCPCEMKQALIAPDSLLRGYRVKLVSFSLSNPSSSCCEHLFLIGVCPNCEKVIWGERSILPAPQYPNADFTSFFGVPEITPVSWDTPPHSTPLADFRAVQQQMQNEIVRAYQMPMEWVSWEEYQRRNELVDNNIQWHSVPGMVPVQSVPPPTQSEIDRLLSMTATGRIILREREKAKEEAEPSVETTTAELRKMIGEINANRLRFDAEGKFREEGEHNPNKLPKKKWWRKKEK